MSETALICDLALSVSVRLLTPAPGVARAQVDRSLSYDLSASLPADNAALDTGSLAGKMYSVI